MKTNWTHFNPIETYLRVVHYEATYQRAVKEAFNEYKVPVPIFTFKWGNGADKTGEAA